jgi:predicted Fe-Mo cluster-binding NifX family protein
MAATMKVIESGVSILFITQSIGPVALQLLTTYGVLVFQVNEVKYR